MQLSSLPAFVFALAAALALVFAFSGAGTAYASGAALYENPNTGEVFLTPGPGRVKVGQSVVNQLLKPNAKKTTRQINNLKATEKKLEASLKTVKGETLPAWTKHITLGTLVYMGYGYYSNTGFAPALQLQENPAGPGNNGYNAFNVNRAYLIFLYHQDNWFLKLTPNINKSNDSTGSSSSSGFNAGNEYFRLKYAFLQFNHVYDANGLTVNFKAGQFPTPMIAWEDGLLGYHVAERTPWGVLGVTSTQAGLGVSGKFRANGKIYMAYNAGFFDNATFHQGEDVDQKSPQARVSFYPLGADSNLDGLGISGYYAWSQSNSFEGYYGILNNNDNPTARASAILDYKTPQGVIAAQFDYGLNALAGGYASGAGSISQDAGSWCGIGVNTTGVYGCNLIAGAAYPKFAAGLGALDAYQHNTEHGYDAFGYYNIPNSKFGVFGLIQRFYYSDPSSAFWVNKIGTNITSGNPYDSQRGVVGVAYHLNSHITLTADWQNYQFLYAKDYRNLPASNSEYLDYGQWMGQTNAYFLQARIAF
jgi:hypothetical protein